VSREYNAVSKKAMLQIEEATMKDNVERYMMKEIDAPFVLPRN